MLNPRTATTTTKALHIDAGPAVPVADDQPTYRYAGDGRFLPDNQAAIEECVAWNTFADRWNARTVAGSLRQ